MPRMEPSIVEGTLRSGAGGPGADGSIRFSLASPATTDKKVGQFKRFRHCRGSLGRRRLRVITFSDQTAAAFVETDGRKARLDRAFRKSGRRRQRNSGVVQFGYRQNSVPVGHRIKRNVRDADRRRRHWLPGRNGSPTASTTLRFDGFVGRRKSRRPTDCSKESDRGGASCRRRRVRRLHSAQQQLTLSNHQATGAA